MTPWPITEAHNYNHLLEQPVLFYAVCILLMVLGGEARAAVWLAWAYVAIRVVHSLAQATSNIVRIRFCLFFLGSLALLGLIVLTALDVFA